MTGDCIGYLATGNVCRRPATIIDREAGGLLCDECAAAKRARARGRREGPGRDAARTGGRHGRARG